jgi:Amt family ammonium transporter
VLVILMTIPGLALFYGGLVRSKNMLSVLMQVFVGVLADRVLWVIYGYSSPSPRATPSSAALDKLFLKGVTPIRSARPSARAWYIPEFIFVAFQGPSRPSPAALIIGAFAERIKFSAVLLFMVLWFTFSYLPMAHMVWYWDGPDAYPPRSAGCSRRDAGFLFQKGALDFAGGTVVHINAGVAGLVGAFMVGKRVGYGGIDGAAQPDHDHDRRLAAVGGLVRLQRRLGNLEANGTAALAFVNTWVATALHAVLDVGRVDHQGQAVDAGRRVRCGGRPGGDHPGCGFVGPMVRIWSSACWRVSSACGASMA